VLPFGNVACMVKLSIDLYKLPIDRDGYNIVIILVNRFSKRLFLIPYYKNINAKETA